MTRNQYERIRENLTVLDFYLDKQKETPDRDKAYDALNTITGVMNVIEPEPYQGDLFRDWHGEEDGLADPDSVD